MRVSESAVVGCSGCESLKVVLGVAPALLVKLVFGVMVVVMHGSGSGVVYAAG